ncbi:MAG: hypothetical protein H6732_00725 [Alphaproteobacteria bacterium]|nr:hypothetical protein [Alphaproteobacteria bacterium]
MPSPIRCLGTVGLLLLAGPALAEPGAHTLAIAAAGGWDYPTQLPVAGLQLAVRHDGRRGFAFLGEVQGLWAFLDDRPLVRAEAGFAAVVPTRERALVRVGVVGGASLYTAPYAIPFQVGGAPTTDDYGHLGVLPHGAFVAELGWRRDAARGAEAWAFGVRLGAALSTTSAACAVVASDCAQPQVVFDGGIQARLRLQNGLYVEVLAGPSPRVGLGFAPALPGRRARVEEVAPTEEPAAVPEDAGPT